MVKEIVICDTNIFIHVLNNNQKTIDNLQKIGLEFISMSVITAMELLQGMSNKIELTKMQKTIKQYHIIDFTKEVSELTLKLITHYSLSHKLQIPDAIIGATAAVFGLPLYTYNIKDFSFIPELRLLEIDQ